MELALDEFRKRLLDPRPLVDLRPLEHSAEANPRTVESIQDVRAAVRDTEGRGELARAVERSLGITARFRSDVGRLEAVFDPIENAGTAVLASFEPLAGLIDELSELAASFHQVREFTEQVRIASADYPAMNPLHQQLLQFEASFSARVAELAESVESIRGLRERIERIASALDALATFEKKTRMLAKQFAPRELQAPAYAA